MGAGLMVHAARGIAARARLFKARDSFRPVSAERADAISERRVVGLR